MNWSLAAYSALAWAAQPLLRRKLHRRAQAEPGYGESVGERFGRYAPADLGRDGAGHWVWVHAVSLGETRAASCIRPMSFFSRSFSARSASSCCCLFRHQDEKLPF